MSSQNEVHDCTIVMIVQNQITDVLYKKTIYPDKLYIYMTQTVN